MPSSQQAVLSASDEQLVARIRQGDERAFFALYQRYARFVGAIAYRLMGDNCDVDDVVQETFVALNASVHTLREDARVKSWLAIVATRVVRKRLGRRGRQHRLVRHIKILAPSRTTPRDRELVEELYQALDRLPLRLRLPWIINRIEGAPLDETAARCGVSLATVKRRLVRATARLMRRVEPALIESARASRDVMEIAACAASA